MGQSPACPAVSLDTGPEDLRTRAVPRLPGREQQGPRSEAGLDSGAGSWCPIRPGTVPGRGRPAPPPRARRRPRGPPLAWGAGAHGGACPPTPASRSSRRRRPAPTRAASMRSHTPFSRRARYRAYALHQDPHPAGRAPAGAPRPGCATARRRSWRAAGSGGACPAPAGRAAGARAAPTRHRPGHGGRMRLYSSSEAFAGIAIRFHTTRDTPRASPRPARHAAPTRLTQHALGRWGARGGRRPALRRRDPGPRSRGRGGAEAASSPRRKPAAGPRPTLKSC